MYLGHSRASRTVHEQLREAIESNEPVLLIGKAGTGKAVLARLIHHFCGATALPFTRLDPATLTDDEPLPDFGYLGPVESLSLRQQAGLRNRIGLGRLIVATRLQPGSRAWHERLDPRLLRWCRMRIQLPSLQARIDDLDALATRYLLQQGNERPIAGLSNEALECLRQYEWPGEVSELEEVLQHALRATQGSHIELWHLPARLRIRDAATLGTSPMLQLSLSQAEDAAISRALRHTRGNKRKAARLLGVSESTLYRKLARSRQSLDAS